MIDFYYWPTPNGWKISILLEELGCDYNTIYLDIGKGDQHKAEFLAISPNNRMPAIVDHDVQYTPVPVFESAAIAWYLAEKTGKFLATDPVGRKETLEWLFWQTGNQGPMTGQLSHFVNYAPKDQVYSQQRYLAEANRCLAVLERRLKDRDYLVGDYSIADMVAWPWVLIAKPLGQTLDKFPNVARWRNTIKTRPAVQRGVDLGKESRRSAPPSAAERKNLFGQATDSDKTA